ncbi:hypothetical protein [Pedobacter deserti]|uniref:hypothetical protein n=1 Tax=Pedobacter deserti TaxID=2817382 RepID=UPI00210C0ECE|nr:hypothetical protein [Pedobacter sp. SYSU D00382]
MKALFCSLLILTCLAVSTTTAQDRSNQDNPEATIFGLLPKKHKYDGLMSRTRTNSAEERKKLAAEELKKSDYGSAVKDIKTNKQVYLAYINKEITTNADSLSKQYINYQYIPPHDSGARDRYVISKLDYLRAVKYSLFEYESDELLELYLIPGVKMKYPSRDQLH